MPMPDGMILLKSDPRRICENIKKRRRVATIHQGLNEQQLHDYTEKTQYHMEYAAGYFREKGVKVMEINLDSARDNHIDTRSEERRVGKESRTRMWEDERQKKDRK